VTVSGSKSWVYRYMLNGKARSMGLGAYPETTIAQARENRDDAKKQLGKGIDPLEDRAEKEAAQKELEQKQTAPKKSDDPNDWSWITTFSEATETYISACEAGWKNSKHRQQWRNTIASYAAPVIGRKHPSAITTEDICTILQPIWLAKPETASRLRGRLERILDACKVKKLRSGENPAMFRGISNTCCPNSRPKGNECATIRRCLGARSRRT
jgi:hypothetical protein